MMNLTVCDKCKINFDIKPKKVEKKFGKELLTINYFECPNCKEIYIINVDNSETEKLIKQFNEQQNKIKRCVISKGISTMEEYLRDAQLKVMLARKDSIKCKYARMQEKLKCRYAKRIKEYLHSKSK